MDNRYSAAASAADVWNDSPSSNPAPLQALANEEGRFYDFKSPLVDAYFQWPSATPLPQGASPILDEELGLCIGYSVQRTEGVWHSYDADGGFATIEEAPLEAPLIDPTLGFLTGLSVARHFRSGIRAVGPFLTRGELPLRPMSAPRPVRCCARG